MMWWITLAQAEQVASGIEVSIGDAPIHWERCYPNQVRQESMCAEILVPVDHSNPQAEKMPLHIVKLSAIRSNAEVDPVFVLAGGPGQGASEVISTLYQRFEKFINDGHLYFWISVVQDNQTHSIVDTR